MIGEKLHNRYILHHVINIGGMGIIYRASDMLMRGMPDEFVALKRVLAGTIEQEDVSHGRVALAHEFHVLATLRHPNVISVLDYGFDSEGMPFYTMELLEDARDFLLAGKNLSLNTQVQFLIQLLQALSYLHRHSIIHRDIKPGNVLVLPDNHLKVLDFGLASLHDQITSNHVVGTLKYMAPELLMHQTSTLSSDLYAAGLLAFEMITSIYPYDETNTHQLLYDILSKSVDMTPLLMVARQHGLNAVQCNRFTLIFERLLTKDHHTRYTSAYEVIEDLCITLNMSPPTESASIRAGYIESARFVGRDREMQILETALERILPASSDNTTSEAGGAVWLIGGEGGIGKSRLLEELRIRALVRGALVLMGSGDVDVKRPYAWWGDIIRRLSIECAISDSEAALLAYIVPDLPRILNREVANIKVIENSGHLHKRLTYLIIDLLRRATQENQRAIVLLLDDLHRVDDESFLILQELLSIISRFRLLVVGAYCDEDAQGDVWLRLPDSQRIQLNRLSADDIARIGATMFGDGKIQQDVIDFIHRETEGNLFFLVEVVRALAEDAGGLQNIGIMTLPEHVLAGGVERLIQRRLERVPASSRPLLNLAAVAGREIDLRLLSHIIMRRDAPTTSINSLDTWLVMCAEASVLEVRGNVWRFTHDKLREYIIKQLSKEDFQKLHCQIAESLEAIYGDKAHYTALLAYHWRKAGEYQQEYRYAILAGEYAFTHGSARQAVYYFSRVLHLSAECPIDTTVQQSELFLNLGLSYIQTGDFTRAHSLLKRVLQEYSNTNDYGKGKALLGLGRLYYASAEYKMALFYLSECLNIMTALDKQRDMAMTLVEISRVHGVLERFELAMSTLFEARRIFGELGDNQGLALTLQEIGHIMLLQGSLKEARSYFEEARAILAEFDDDYGIVSCDLNLSKIALRLKDIDHAYTQISDVLRLSLNIGAFPLLLRGLSLYAQWLSLQGHHERAVRFLGAIANHPAYDGNLRAELAPFVNYLRNTLPQTTYMVEYSRGQLGNPRVMARDILGQKPVEKRSS